MGVAWWWWWGGGEAFADSNHHATGGVGRNEIYLEENGVCAACVYAASGTSECGALNRTTHRPLWSGTFHCGSDSFSRLHAAQCSEQTHRQNADARRESARHTKRASLRPKPMRARVAASLPARKLGVPLLIFLTKHVDYPGIHLSRYMARGMGNPGDATASMALSKRDTSTSTDVGRLKPNLSERSTALLRHIARTNNPIVQRRWWEISMLELAKGWMRMPTPVTQRDRARAILSRRPPHSRST